LDSQQTPEHDPGVTRPDEPIDDAQLSPRAWLARNGPVLLLILAAFVFIYYKLGLEGTWITIILILGLGAVVFIHELGHFLVAKWCDVHVQTFSIGFGPALPGCSYKWGETTYKLALFPLGGYVKMVGEGGENDEEDTDPRSYKNKTVGQRMAIISAGVVMNVLFGLVVFILAFKIGVHLHPPVAGVIEAGGPAWVKGVRFGDELVQVGDVSHPYFEDLKVQVMLSDPGEHIPFVWRTPGQEARSVSIEPRKTKDEANPVIGVGYPWSLKLPEKREVPTGSGPVERGSAAADARALDLGPDDRLLAATDPIPLNPIESPARASLTDLNPNDPAGDLAGRLRALAGKPVTVTVRRAGADHTDTLTLQPDSGFQFGDRIVGTTDPDDNASFNPFHTAALRHDPRDPQGRNLDYFQFITRLNRLAGHPVVIQVERKGEVVNIFMPPSYHRVIPGVRMAMGTVTALRDGSTAEAAGVKVRDTITGVTLTDGKESITFATKPNPGEKRLDPLRLVFDLRQWVAGRDGVTATLKVRRVMEHDADAIADISDLKWDNSWRYDEELPLGSRGSLAIPELGIAYQVLAQVAAVDDPQVQKKLRAEDFILAWTFQTPSKEPGEPEKWGKPVELGSKDNPTGSADPSWASYFYRMQRLSSPLLRLQVRHADGEKEDIELELQPDTSWPLFDPLQPSGLFLFPMQDRIAEASSLGDAVPMGFRYTRRTIVQIYMFLKSVLITRRVSATENLAGPIDIPPMLYEAAGRGWGDFFLLLAAISVNLAVVNFLPIPVLDGGHMVFLLYEKLRGRPASEHVRQASTLVGILFLVSLMIFVIGLGLYRWVWPWLTGS
jgi:regulator of sigma E protease